MRCLQQVVDVLLLGGHLDAFVGGGLTLLQPLLAVVAGGVDQDAATGDRHKSVPVLPVRCRTGNPLVRATTRARR
jgi:hypothetical protein